MMRSAPARGGALVASALFVLSAVAPGCNCAGTPVPPSAIIMVTPAGAPAGATVELTVRGSEQDGAALTAFGADTTMTFDGMPVMVAVESASLLTATVTIPAAHPAGTMVIAVYGALPGQVDPLTTPFNVLDAGITGTITIEPAWGTAGQPSPLLTVTGEDVTFIPGVTTVTFDSNLVTVTTPVEVLSPTVLTLGVYPDAALPDGFVTLTVTNGETFVAQGAWGIVNPNTAGTIEVMPPRAPRGARDFALTIAGSDITFSTDPGATVVEFSTPGVTVRSVNATLMDLTVAIDVAPEATLGDGIVLVYTGPSKAFATFSVDDRIVPAIAATRAGAAPPPGAAATFDVDTAGLLLDPLASVLELTPGNGLDSAALTVLGTSAGLLDAVVSRGTPAGFAPFAIHDLFTGDRVLGAVPVAAAGPPQITGVLPVSLAPGGAGTFALDGDGTSFAAGTTVVEVLPLGGAVPGEVAPGALTVLGPAQATVDLSALAGAAPGPAIVRLTTGGEVAEGLLLVGSAPAAGLVPAEIPQGRTIVAELVADGVDLTAPGAAVTSLAPDGDGDALPDVSVAAVYPVSASRARVVLVASDGAPPGPVQFLVDDGTSPLLADLAVVAGTPTLSIPTDSIRPGDVLQDVSVVGHFTSFGADTVATVAGLTDGLYVERTTVAGQVATVKLTAALDVPPGSYPLVLGTGAETVATTLTIDPITINPLALPLPGQEAVVPGSLNPGGGASSAYYAFTAVAGTVATFTADATLSTLDPALRLYALDGVTILAENGDLDPAITLSAQVTWAFDTTGTYYVRLDAETVAGGAYSLRTRVLDAPRTEVEPNDDPATATDLAADPLADALIVRGDIATPGGVDFYAFEVGAVTPGDPLSTVVVDTAARGLVDHLGAAPDLIIEVLAADGSTLMAAGPTSADDRAVASGHLFDPTLALVPPAAGTYLLRVSSYAGTTGPYLLNLRGPLVINEIFFNPQGASGAGTFLELAGVAGLAASGLTLEVRAYDCAGVLDPTAGLDASLPMWSAVVFPADGLFVFGADATVANYDLLVPESAVDFSEADGTRIDLLVTPAGGVPTVIDSVHFAAAPASCTGGEGGFGPNPPDGADTSIGRAFGFDGDDNARDFRTQLRPSPGERNVTDF